jgi:hypothetical protein
VRGILGGTVAGNRKRGLAIAIPQAAFAQSDPLDGIWQLSLAKSKLTAGGVTDITARLIGQRLTERLGLCARDGQEAGGAGFLRGYSRPER